MRLKRLWRLDLKCPFAHHIVTHRILVVKMATCPAEPTCDVDFFKADPDIVSITPLGNQLNLAEPSNIGWNWSAYFKYILVVEASYLSHDR